MSTIPGNCRYTKTHEWVRLESDGTTTVGITEHAQEALGDIVFIELPEIGTNVTNAEECGVIESVKSASDLYSPISGEVVAVNDNAVENPALLNSDPHSAGWLFRVSPTNQNDIDNLMDAITYTKFLAETEE